jgi:hypothetical protein
MSFRDSSSVPVRSEMLLFATAACPVGTELSAPGGKTAVAPG